MTYYLFLDDVRIPGNAWVYSAGKTLSEASAIRNSAWTIVRTHADFVNTVKQNGLPVAVSFDHDLCYEHMRHYHSCTAVCGVIEYANLKTPTGKASAQFLVDYCKENGVSLPTWYIHSANEIGRQEIRKVLESHD